MIALQATPSKLAMRGRCSINIQKITTTRLIFLILAICDGASDVFKERHNMLKVVPVGEKNNINITSTNKLSILTPLVIYWPVVLWYQEDDGHKHSYS